MIAVERKSRMNAVDQQNTEISSLPSEMECGTTHSPRLRVYRPHRLYYRLRLLYSLYRYGLDDGLYFPGQQGKYGRPVPPRLQSEATVFPGLSSRSQGLPQTTPYLSLCAISDSGTASVSSASSSQQLQSHPPRAQTSKYATYLALCNSLDASIKAAVCDPP